MIHKQSKDAYNANIEQALLLFDVKTEVWVTVGKMNILQFAYQAPTKRSFTGKGKIFKKSERIIVKLLSHLKPYFKQRNIYIKFTDVLKIHQLKVLSQLLILKGTPIWTCHKLPNVACTIYNQSKNIQDTIIVKILKECERLPPSIHIVVLDDGWDTN